MKDVVKIYPQDVPINTKAKHQFAELITTIVRLLKDALIQKNPIYVKMEFVPRISVHVFINLKSASTQIYLNVQMEYAEKVVTS